MGVEDRPQPEVIDSPDSSIDDGQVEVVTEQNLDSARETMRDRIANLYEDVSESDHEIADELKSELDSLAYNLVDVNEQELEAILERTESALTTIEATFQGGLEEVLGEELGSEEIVDRKPLRSRRAERVRQKPEDPVKTAQALQHIEEMSGGNWKKIDERYREFAELLDKGGVKLGDDKIALAHERGIQAARNLGNLGDAKERYEAAGQLDGAEKIGQTIGIVSLKVSPSEVSGEEILKPSLMPFDPTLRNNISVAQAALQERGSYQGSLPVGTYDFGGQTLQVESGGEYKMRG